MTSILHTISTAYPSSVLKRRAIIALCLLIPISTTMAPFAVATPSQWSQSRSPTRVRTGDTRTNPQQTYLRQRRRERSSKISAPENLVVQPAKPDAPQSKLGQLAAETMRKEQSQAQNREGSRTTGASSSKISKGSSSRFSGSNKWTGKGYARLRPRRAPKKPLAPIQPANQNVAELETAFVVNVPNVQIELKDNQEGKRVIGRTGEDGKLIAKIKPGLYVATLSHPNYLILTRQIEVRPGKITPPFELELGTPPANPVVTLTPALTPEPAITPEPATVINKTLTAEAILNRYLDPKQTDSLTADDWGKVLSQTNDALSQDADNMPLKARSFFAQGQLAYLEGRYSDALVAFTDAAQALPKSALPYMGKGDTYLALKQYGEAIKEYEQAHKLYSQEANRDLAMAHRGIGNAWNAQGKTEEAIKQYNQAKSFGYFSPEMGINLARALMKQKRWRLALIELAEASKLKQTAEMMILTGDCYNQLKQTSDAGRSYLTATELDNKSATAFFKLGGELLEQRKYQEAKQVLDRAVALDPTGIKIDVARARKMVVDAEKKLSRS